MTGRSYVSSLPRARLRAAALCLVVFVTVACAEPPHKEMDQAQGAIDAARAAGADRYAVDEYSAATEALRNANTAVGQRDYRLALNHALESREQAQNAARQAADTRVQLRGEVERSMAEVAALLAQANTRLVQARTARAPRRLVDQAASGIDAVSADVQKAGEAIKQEDYLVARQALGSVKERLDTILLSLETKPRAGAPPRRRPTVRQG